MFLGCVNTTSISKWGVPEVPLPIGVLNLRASNLNTLPRRFFGEKLLAFLDSGSPRWI